MSQFIHKVIYDKSQGVETKLNFTNIVSVNSRYFLKIPSQADKYEIVKSYIA